MRAIGSFISGTRGRGIRLRWGLFSAVAVFIMQYPLTVSAWLVMKPMTQVAFVGSRVKMGCTRDISSQPVDWEFAPADTNISSYIYANRQIVANVTSRYRIDTDNATRYDIIMDSVDSSYAGTYICTQIADGVANSSSASAQLIVLASDPVCGTNASASNGSIVEGDYIQMWCKVNYTGNRIPDMVWNNTITKTMYISNVTEATSIQTIPLYAADDGVTQACRTSFNAGNYKHVRSPRPGETPATNTPDYQYTWTFTPRVLYAPKGLLIVPKNDIYWVGDRIVCSANGNPTPAYEWTDIGTNKTTLGSTLTIDNSLVSDKDHSFNCTAYNMVAGIRRETAETITFKVREGSANAAVSTTSLSAAVLFAEIALAFAVALSVKG